eukprot:PLAT5269.3.p1 GENE.PLAT5269.3~~PLAT5269.3.p1  ORF type:complete len:461 (-),score=95.68 PLAT5269.3:1364-2746(-)
MLQCPGCDYVFDAAERSPLLLPCGHCYCRDCVAGETAIDCASGCGTQKFDDADSLPVNALLVALLQSSAVSALLGGDENDDPAVDAAVAVVFCGACREKDMAEATLWCSACSCELCPSCSEDLHRRRAFRSHTVVPLADKVEAEEEKGARDDDICDAHREPLVLYCTTCSCRICAFCERYEGHASHSVISLREAAEIEAKAKLKAKEAASQMLLLPKEVSAARRSAEFMMEAVMTKLDELQEECDAIAAAASAGERSGLQPGVIVASQKDSRIRVRDLIAKLDKLFNEHSITFQMKQALASCTVFSGRWDVDMHRRTPLPGGAVKLYGETVELTLVDSGSVYYAFPLTPALMPGQLVSVKLDTGITGERECNMYVQVALVADSSVPVTIATGWITPSPGLHVFIESYSAVHETFLCSFDDGVGKIQSPTLSSSGPLPRSGEVYLMCSLFRTGDKCTVVST